MNEEEIDTKRAEIHESKAVSMTRYISEQVSLNDEPELDFLKQKQEMPEEGNKLPKKFDFCFYFKSVLIPLCC